MAMFNFDIPSLRKQSVMQDWGQPQQSGYDWSQPNVDYSGGEMPEMQVPYPTPSVGPYETQPPRELFGREPTPTVPDPTAGPTIAPNSASGQAGMGAPRQIRPMGQEDSLGRYTEAVDSVYRPDFTDRDRLRALMDAAPERQSPGWGRGLSAIALGIGSKSPEEGLKAQEAVLFAPHRRAMADWTAKAEPFTKTAEIEGRQNVSERTLAGNMVNAVTQADRIDAQRTRDEGKQAVAEERNKIYRLAAEARANKWEVKIVGPDVMEFPPGGGPGRRLGPSGNLTEEDKINLEGRYRVAAAQEAAKAGQTRAETSQAREFTDPEGNVWIQKPNSAPQPSGLPQGSVPSSAPSSSGGGMLEKNRVQQSKMESLFLNRSPNVKKGTNGKYNWIKRPEVREDSWMPGNQAVTQEQVDEYDAERAEVDPSYKPPVSGAAPVAPRESSPNPPTASYSPENFPTPKFSESAKKGLGPQNVPAAKPFGSPTIIESRGGAAPEYNYERNKLHPDNIRRTSKDGKIVEISIDGGNTWTRRR